MSSFHQYGSFARNLAAYGASEIASKLSRLLVVVAVARSLDLAAIGVAAAAMAASDIFKALTENGVGQKIISAPANRLAATCRTAHRIFWAWCLGLFSIQAALAGIYWAATGDKLLGLLIVILAGEYLFMPAGLVQASLAMRAGKLRQTAAIAGGQIVGANLVTVLLVLLWPTALALVLPRLLSAPLWTYAMRRLHPWQADPGAGTVPLSYFVRFGASVLGVEIVKALRLQADKLVIGWMLGAEALGLYFMAFNAGLGLATSFSLALSKVLFPYLCTAPDRAAALRQAILISTGFIAPAVILQALLAPVYVPILFGPGWEGAQDIVSILCLAAIPGVIWSSAAGWLRAEGRPGTEFVATALLALALVLNTVIMAPFGLVHVAAGYLAVASIMQIGASWPALSVAFRPLLQKV